MKFVLVGLSILSIVGCCRVPEADLTLWQAKMDRVGLYQESPCSEYGKRYRAYMDEERRAYAAEMQKDPDFENKLRAEFLAPLDDAGHGGYPVTDYDIVFFERHKDDPAVKARFYYIYFCQNDGERGFYARRTFPWLQYSSVFTVEDYEEALKYHLLSYNDGCLPEHVRTYQECLAEKQRIHTPEYVREMNKSFNAPWVPICP